MNLEDRKLAWAGVVVLAVISFEAGWFVFIGPTNSRPNYSGFPWGPAKGVHRLVSRGDAGPGHRPAYAAYQRVSHF